MICRNCNKIIPDGRNFCPHCGSKIAESHDQDGRKNNSVNNENSRENHNKKSDNKYVAIISVLTTLLCCALIFIFYQNTHQQVPQNVTNNVEEDVAAVTDTEVVVQEQESKNEYKAEETPVIPEKSDTDKGGTTDNNPAPNNTAAENESNTNNEDKETGPSIDVNSIEIPRNYFAYNGHSYGIYDAKNYGIASYEDVKEFCRNQGGYLAVINDIYENDELFDFVSNNSRVTAFFGYSDEKNESDWKWSEGYSSFTNWTYNNREKQPDNGSGYGGDEDYAEFNYERGTNSANDGSWNDAPFMENTSLFICEWDSDLGLY